MNHKVRWVTCEGEKSDQVLIVSGLSGPLGYRSLGNYKLQEFVRDEKSHAYTWQDVPIEIMEQGGE